MHKYALLPVLALLIASLFVGRDGEPRPSVAINREVAEATKAKPFRPVWEAAPAREGLLGLPVSGQVCVTPDCAGCDLDKSTFFRKKPGHPKYQ